MSSRGSGDDADGSDYKPSPTDSEGLLVACIDPVQVSLRPTKSSQRKRMTRRQISFPQNVHRKGNHDFGSENDLGSAPCKVILADRPQPTTELQASAKDHFGPSEPSKSPPRCPRTPPRTPETRRQHVTAITPHRSRWARQLDAAIRERDRTPSHYALRQTPTKARDPEARCTRSPTVRDVSTISPRYVSTRPRTRLRESKPIPVHPMHALTLPKALSLNKKIAAMGACGISDRAREAIFNDVTDDVAQSSRRANKSVVRDPIGTGHLPTRKSNESIGDVIEVYVTRPRASCNESACY